MGLSNTQHKSAILGILLMMSITLSSASSKMAGAAWLVLVVWGLSSWWGQRSGTVAQNDAQRASQAWLLICLGALFLRSISVFYWGDSWDERHAEIRLLLGSLGAYGMLRAGLAGPALDKDLLVRSISHAVGLACLIGFGIHCLVDAMR